MDRQETHYGAVTTERAAQYVRMSTDHQRYSTANQRKAIAEYADARSLSIVRTYADEGKSGLSFEGRSALKQLIADVVSGSANFSTILVYDVSRWGRFQDNDESAYYEFICKKAGVKVCYCAELFENDESLTSTILKGMKRAMAAEYSRELSKKVFYAQSRIARLGYHVGGGIAFGLRRLLVKPDGTAVMQLERRQYKAINNDRVILIPGPPEEVRIVRKIFQQFVHGRKSPSEIAKMLNANRVPNPSGKPWQYLTIRKILMNEVYVGNNIYNRQSRKLKAKTRVSNPPEQWVRANGAFKPIVSVELFEAAKQLINKTRWRSTEEMLDRLRALLKRKHYLSAQLIRDTEGMPHVNSYLRRFGGLRNAYRSVGYNDDPLFKRAEVADGSRALLKSLLAQVANNVTAGGGSVRTNTHRFFVVVNETVSIMVVLGRYALYWRDARSSWRAKVKRRSVLPNYAIVARLDESNQSIADYYFLPSSELKGKTEFWITKKNYAAMETYRHKSLDFVSEFVATGCVSLPVLSHLED